ncbi:hypothetical protein [Dongshaea marina]|uniref:hypothetical protein n=1 Tax=Dongshaea marina TaxID=2047966 RepID=UPI000D3E6A8C|nr:hypothetical protein [Dongshaea marina]
MKKLFCVFVLFIAAGAAHGTGVILKCERSKGSMPGACFFNSGQTQNDMTKIRVTFYCAGNNTTTHDFTVVPPVGVSVLYFGGPEDSRGKGCSVTENAMVWFYQKNGERRRTNIHWRHDKDQYGRAIFIMENWSQPKNKACWHWRGNTGCAKIKTSP